MANFVAAVALSLALRLPPGEVALRAAYALTLNLLAYLSNDYCDVRHDLAIGRAEQKTRFLFEHLRAALVAQWLLFGALVVVGLAWHPPMVLGAAAGAGLCLWYSATLKARPVVDVLAMTAWGAAMPSVAVPLDRPLSWALLGLLALFSTCFESIQVLRDRAEDSAAGVRTTAVVLGERATSWLVRVAAVGAALYAWALLDSRLGPLLALAALLPWDAAAPSRYWDRVRLLFGVVWIGILFFIWWSGAAHGWFRL